ncbi:MAG TPA: hypothetical protein VFS43_48140 [Polyangiaceae bacterium]|nr:hypothetical protein [Polyangiaceae bacterium]
MVRLLDALVIAFVVAAALCLVASVRLFTAKSDGAALYTLLLGAVAAKAAAELVRRRGSGAG